MARGLTHDFLCFDTRKIKENWCVITTIIRIGNRKQTAMIVSKRWGEGGEERGNVSYPAQAYPMIFFYEVFLH